ncbi:unnamed protein product [Aspergillus oryzae RIB40]|uniref:DNA, SC005 n=2 Tax=Aspergillus oryzae TaxID=5062 RepID=Q2UQ66_ASPOR|nr:unnamed protein product [Aspergillus oryzae RIB40]EIT82321.1 hypothetical protein Ao3042_00518 [Aspergillus oryzae 3.042]KDE79789.1 hypothetical protein AO1008_06304 [Aspergillus oryzae 100-8]BAE56299.1 unnamed protein product [Aspergillus oryzae RIB40]|eukprot:EIT82321.1 hypothetical protein Ao3042_00518 [Aspergillus oryzae 3.042]
MTVRKDQPDGCTIELAECHKRAQALEGEIEIWQKKDRDSATQIIDLTKQIKELEEKISQTGKPTISYGYGNQITRKKIASACDCMKLCATYTTCKWAHFSRFGGSSRDCVLYSNARKLSYVPRIARDGVFDVWAQLFRSSCPSLS